MNLDPQFQSLFDGFTKELDEAEARNTWMPDNGEYVVVVKSVKTVKQTDTDSGKTYAGFAVTVKICSHEHDPNLYGAEFRLGYVTRKNAGAFKTLAIGLAGKPIPAEEMVKAIADSKGTVLKVKVRRSMSKGTEYANCDILKVMETAPATVEVQAATPKEKPA